MDKKAKYLEIGQRIKQARETKGLTQAQLGEKLASSVTATAISLYESGDREVGVDVLAEMAKILDVSVEFLATGKHGEAPSINVALRADKDLWKNQKARKQVLDFIEFVKKKSEDKK